MSNPKLRRLQVGISCLTRHASLSLVTARSQKNLEIKLRSTEYPDIISGMTGQPAAMHVARIRSGYTDKQGRRHQYESAYLRRTYRDGGKVRHETLANLSGPPEQAVGSIEAALKGAALVPAGQAMTITRSLFHGHVAAVHAMAARLGLPALLGPAGPQRDLALALVISRVVAPGSKLSTLAWWSDTTLGADLGVAQA